MENLKYYEKDRFRYSRKTHLQLYYVIYFVTNVDVGGGFNLTGVNLNVVAVSDIFKKKRWVDLSFIFPLPKEVECEEG